MATFTAVDGEFTAMSLFKKQNVHRHSPVLTGSTAQATHTHRYRHTHRHTHTHRYRHTHTDIDTQTT